MSDQHTVRSYDNELEELTVLLLRMGEVVHAQLKSATESFLKGDAAAAAVVVEQDLRIDEWEHRVDGEVVAIVARRQPMARDLRLILAAGRMANDLERMGDHAKNIGKRAMKLGGPLPSGLEAEVRVLADTAVSMLSAVLEAFSSKDDELAQKVWLADKKVDDLYDAVFQRIVEAMRADPACVEVCTQLLFVVKSLERVGDHATNLAENVRFISLGEMPGATRET